jgi:hypothetical protein
MSSGRLDYIVRLAPIVRFVPGGPMWGAERPPRKVTFV